MKMKLEINVIKEEDFRQEYEALTAAMDAKANVLLLAARQKGASSWLSALLLKKRGYVLNNQEFRDGLCLRYGWQISGTPLHCARRRRNSLHHVLT